MKAKEKQWWGAGVRFECQGSGKCCVSRGEYGYVYLTLSDRQRFAKFFRIPTGTFTRRYCQKADGIWSLRDFNEACVFFKNKQCSVYEARPDQCRTWPFWPENMKAKAWAKEVRGYCPGVGKGKLWTADEVQQQLRIQEKSEEKY